MKDLNSQEKQKLAELKSDHVFQSLLDKLESPVLAPWKESDGVDEVYKHHQWIYHSGQKAQYDNFMWLFKPRE